MPPFWNLNKCVTKFVLFCFFSHFLCFNLRIFLDLRVFVVKTRETTISSGNYFTPTKWFMKILERRKTMRSLKMDLFYLIFIIHLMFLCSYFPIQKKTIERVIASSIYSFYWTKVIQKNIGLVTYVEQCAIVFITFVTIEIVTSTVIIALIPRTNFN